MAVTFVFLSMVNLVIASIGQPADSGALLRG
jgi:hypothetical protein